jgi:hypothetical protein
MWIKCVAIGKFLLLACIVVFFTGCGKTVPLKDYIVPMPGIETEKQAALSSAIIVAGAFAGWEVSPVSPGVLQGSFVKDGKYMATVAISYDDKEYRIQYKDSDNLGHTEDGRIYPLYNTWVEGLNQSVWRELFRIIFIKKILLCSGLFNEEHFPMTPPE